MFSKSFFSCFSLKDDKSSKHWLTLLLKNLDTMSVAQPTGPAATNQPGPAKPAAGKLPGGL